MSVALAVKQHNDNANDQFNEKINENEFLRDVVLGLKGSNKSLSPKYFYDELGSKIFDDICKLDEYYPYKTELALLPIVARDLNEILPANTTVVEFGAGSLQKIQPFLESVDKIKNFVPIDISGEHLASASEQLQCKFPSVKVTPKTGDFTKEIDLCDSFENRMGFFPGSTIGNFTPSEALKFLHSARITLGKGSRLLIGVDTKKSPSTLHNAYNDSKGVTAKFNLNVLKRINEEFDAGFELDKFEHYAFYNAQQGRIEMHLISLGYQRYELAGEEIVFSPGESIHTENSYKYAPNEFQTLTAQAGWETEQLWLAKDDMFSTFLLKS